MTWNCIDDVACVMALISRRTLTAALLTLPAARAGAELVPAINTTDDQVGDALDRSDFLTANFSTDFSAMPKLRHGLPTSSAPRPLRDPAFFWTSGYFQQKPSPGIPSTEAGLKPAFSWFSAELQTYPNADAIAASGYSPFSVANGVLTITADRTPPAMLPFIPPGYATDYVSGALVSYPFSQTYGYFEMRARVPAARGTWPAFWLLPNTLRWPPELDVMEILGHDTSVMYTTVHTNATGQHRTYGHSAHAAKLSDDFHDYGMDWGPSKVRFYLDGLLTMSYPTPPDCHSPFYLLANLAIGGPKSWPGPPDATTVFPTRFDIAHIKAWQRQSYLQPG
jgi:beta-glucanase (GH16 family)